MIQNIIPTNGIEMVSLWKNSNPGSEFIGQVVSIPKMSEYTFVCIKFASDINQSEYIWSCIVDTKHTGMITAHMHSLRNRAAFVKPTTNQIHFDNCYYDASRQYTSNGNMIPLVVYGIKGIKTYERDV